MFTDIQSTILRVESHGCIFLISKFVDHIYISYLREISMKNLVLTFNTTPMQIICWNDSAWIYSPITLWKFTLMLELIIILIWYSELFLIVCHVTDDMQNMWIYSYLCTHCFPQILKMILRDIPVLRSRLGRYRKATKGENSMWSTLVDRYDWMQSNATRNNLQLRQHGCHSPISKLINNSSNSIPYLVWFGKQILHSGNSLSWNRQDYSGLIVNVRTCICECHLDWWRLDNKSLVTLKLFV